MPYLPLLWPVPQSGAAAEHNDIILTIGLNSTGRVVHSPISHVSLIWTPLVVTIFPNKQLVEKTLFGSTVFLRSSRRMFRDSRLPGGNFLMVLSDFYKGLCLNFLFVITIRSMHSKMNNTVSGNLCFFFWTFPSS